VGGVFPLSGKALPWREKNYDEKEEITLIRLIGGVVEDISIHSIEVTLLWSDAFL
jgi:hypothetical protein